NKIARKKNILKKLFNYQYRIIDLSDSYIIMNSYLKSNLKKNTINKKIPVVFLGHPYSLNNLSGLSAFLYKTKKLIKEKKLRHSTYRNFYNDLNN
ncbi:MAG: hypothetical protein MJB14_16645, partial [Spirochaetes bacterium]|nr:hypothetical protein [Spirochaetota bacterium]